MAATPGSGDRKVRQPGAATDTKGRGNRVRASQGQPGGVGRCAPFATRLGFVLSIAAASLLLSASPAVAVTEGHFYSFSFGSQGSGSGQFGCCFGMGVAIDQSTGDVYVADTQYARIEKFDAQGNFLQAWGWGVTDGKAESEVCSAPSACQPGLSGSGPGQFENPTAVAVDNSSGPNKGDVYVADTGNAGGGTGNAAILKFNSSGQYLSEIDGSETPLGRFGAMPWQGALWVDGNGYVWVVREQHAAGGQAGEQHVLKFSNEADNEYVNGSEWQRGAEAGSHANYSISTNFAGKKLLVGGLVGADVGLPGHEDSPRFVGASGAAPGPHLPCGGAFDGGTTFDPATSRFFVGNTSSICEFNEEGEEVAPEFGAGHIQGTVGGIAVNETTGDVYVADGYGAGVDVFAPRVVPDVTTGAATNVGHSTATLNGHVAPDPSGGGAVSECYFQYIENELLLLYHSYGYSFDYIMNGAGTTVPCNQATPIAASSDVAAEPSGLNPETTYAYRLVAANSNDRNAGEIRTFTPHWVLGTGTDSATDFTQTTATLHGSFDPAGEDTHYYFEWGTDTSYGHTTEAPPGADAGSASGPTSVSAVLTGLQSYTKYHYRIVTSNGLGTSYGEDQVALTLAPIPPVIEAAAVGGVTDTSATIRAAIIPGFGDTTYRVQYGPTTSYGSETLDSESIGSDDAAHPVSRTLSGLSQGATYHARVIATNFGGTTAGPDLTFTTPAPPAAEVTGASDLGTSSATLHGQVNPHLSTTTYHFEYGPTAAYGSSTQSAQIGADNSSHLLSASLSGLAPGATYHYRLVATNEIGATVSSDGTFTTQPQAPPPPPPTHRCRRGFVKRRAKCVPIHHHHRHRHHRHRHHHGSRHHG
jgi:hypothetical protein